MRGDSRPELPRMADVHGIKTQDTSSFASRRVQSAGVRVARHRWKARPLRLLRYRPAQRRGGESCRGLPGSNSSAIGIDRSATASPPPRCSGRLGRHVARERGSAVEPHSDLPLTNGQLASRHILGARRGERLRRRTSCGRVEKKSEVGAPDHAINALCARVFEVARRLVITRRRVALPAGAVEQRRGTRGAWYELSGLRRSKLIHDDVSGGCVSTRARAANPPGCHAVGRTAVIAAVGPVW